jgi:RimJ/RimL family protein N-acetyltransferase
VTFIKGQRVTLRVLEDADAEIFTKKVNEGLTTQHLWTGSIPMRTADYKARWDSERKAGDVLFAIEAIGLDDRLGSRFIGTCGLHSHRDIYKSWEARFLIFDAEAVGKGLGGEVTRLLTEYGFRRLNAHRIWLGVSEYNKRALKCYLSAGYVFEGRLRDDIFYEGRYHAVIRMSVLEDEWRNIAQ